MPKLIGAIWRNLDGIKVYLGLLISLVGFLIGWLPDALAAAQMNPETVAKIIGALTTALGLLHKIVKGFGAQAPAK